MSIKTIALYAEIRSDISEEDLDNLRRKFAAFKGMLEHAAGTFMVEIDELGPDEEDLPDAG